MQRGTKRDNGMNRPKKGSHGEGAGAKEIQGRQSSCEAIKIDLGREKLLWKSTGSTKSKDVGVGIR